MRTPLKLGHFGSILKDVFVWQSFFLFPTLFYHWLTFIYKFDFFLTYYVLLFSVDSYEDHSDETPTEDKKEDKKEENTKKKAKKDE